MAKGLQKAKIVITGKNGQLAKEFTRILSKMGIEHFAFKKEELDITNVDRVWSVMKEIKPDFVINCAAYNMVDKAEEERDMAFLVNAKAVKTLAEVCSESGAKLVHYSTDYVFGGEKSKPYIEEDNPSPINYYGKTKLLGEMYLKENLNNFLLFRVSWLYGKGRNNFIYKFLNWAKENRELKVSENEVSVPTWAKRVAEVSLKAMEQGLKGLYHLTNSGYASRYEFALKIKEILNLQNSIKPVNSSIFNLKARRPEFSAMDNSKISTELNFSIPHWDYDIKEYLRELK